MDADGVHPLILKYSGHQFQILLLLLFNRVLQTHTWPWTGNNKVIFLETPDKKSYTHPSSYRPITISSYVGKILERILEGRLRQYIEERQIIPNSQHGFRKHNSTLTYLTKLVSTIQHHKACKRKVAGTFLDLQKAFGSIWLNGIIYRLMEIGIGGRMLNLLNSFLKYRKIKLVVNDYTSSLKQCYVGLPQGSVL